MRRLTVSSDEPISLEEIERLWEDSGCVPHKFAYALLAREGERVAATVERRFPDERPAGIVRRLLGVKEAK
jgi:hypothetical protein